MERKTLEIQALDLKMLDDEPGTFEGYASTFNGIDSYGDTVLPGAYAQTLQNRSRPIQMRWNHFGPVIGKWLSAVEDDVGLKMKGQIVLDHSVGRDVYALLRAKAISGLSIGYRIPPGGAEKDGKVRRLRRIDLVEVSVVETPADLGARVGDIKAAIDEIASLKDAEAFARDACGLSHNAARAFVSQVRSLKLRDGDEADDETAQRIALAFKLFTI